jgi:Fe-S-cluster containining protein
MSIMLFNSKTFISGTKWGFQGEKGVSLMTTECKRCGKCCHFTQKLRYGETARTRCIHLIDDGPDRYYCDIYEDRPKTCRDFECLLNRLDDTLSVEEQQKIFDKHCERMTNESSQTT